MCVRTVFPAYEREIGVTGARAGKDLMILCRGVI